MNQGKVVVILDSNSRKATIMVRKKDGIQMRRPENESAVGYFVLFNDDVFGIRHSHHSASEYLISSLAHMVVDRILMSISLECKHRPIKS